MRFASCALSRSLRSTARPRYTPRLGRPAGGSMKRGNRAADDVSYGAGSVVRSTRWRGGPGRPSSSPPRPSVGRPPRRMAAGESAARSKRLCYEHEFPRDRDSIPHHDGGAELVTELHGRDQRAVDGQQARAPGLELAHEATCLRHAYVFSVRGLVQVSTSLPVARSVNQPISNERLW
jgi:hypothetical protein